MSNVEREELREFGLTFFFEDQTSPDYIETVVHEVVYDRYEGVGRDKISIDEMGGTTHLVFFRAKSEKIQKSVFDSNPKEKRARVYVLFHLLNEF